MSIVPDSKEQLSAVLEALSLSVGHKYIHPYGGAMIRDCNSGCPVHKGIDHEHNVTSNFGRSL